MTNVTNALLDRLKARTEQLTQEGLRRGPEGPDNTGEPPQGDDMQARVQRLEDDMKEVRADMKVVRSDLSEIKGKVGMLPGYGGIALIIGSMIGLSTIVQVFARFIPSP